MPRPGIRMIGRIRRIGPIHRVLPKTHRSMLRWVFSKRARSGNSNSCDFQVENRVWCGLEWGVMRTMGAGGAGVLSGIVVMGVVFLLGNVSCDGQQRQPSRAIVRDAAGGGSGVGVVAPARTKVVTKVVTVKLSPLRKWTSIDGKQMMAELLAWPIDDPAAAEKKLEELKIEVVRVGKVRLRKGGRGGKTFVLALDRLAEADRVFVRGVDALHGSGKGKGEGKEEGERGEAPKVRR